jgi:hypothetical protein
MDLSRGLGDVYKRQDLIFQIFESLILIAYTIYKN